MVHNSRSVAALILLVALTVSAQSTPQSRNRAVSPERNQSRQTPNQESRKENGDKASAVRLVEPPRADYLSGEANVAVSGNQNPVIRLGLSPNGATIIEFPSSDRLFNIIPGNSNLVTIEESPTKATDHFIIARPGDGFASPATMANARRAPATSVIVQMQSGLVLTFLFYPVQQLSEQAHRVVITYDRNEVIAARRAAGLAVDLDRPSEAIKSPRSFRKWSDTVHGLSLSVSPVREVSKRLQVVVVAVKNTRKTHARIMPDQPRIYLETIDGKGRPLQIEPVRMPAIDSTVIGELIPGGEARYYAMVYETQILGARQRLRVAVGQSVAADEPATANLTSR